MLWTLIYASRAHIQKRRDGKRGETLGWMIKDVCKSSKWSFYSYIWWKYDVRVCRVCASDTIIASIVGLLVRQFHTNQVCACVCMHLLVQMKRHCLTLKPFCHEKFIAHHYYIEVTNIETERAREDHTKKENGEKERWREMTHLLSIHPSIYCTYEQLPHTFFSHHNWCARFCHLCRTHFIFVMCNDVPTFYMWTARHISLWPGIVHPLTPTTHKSINMYVYIKCLVEWVEIKFHHGRFRHCDGADDKTRCSCSTRLASVAFSLHIIQFLVWIEII